MKKRRWICILLLLALTVCAVGCADEAITENPANTDKITDTPSDTPAAETDSPESSTLLPDSWHIFEYDGVKYDLWEIHTELQGVWEEVRIGKYVVAKAWINKDNFLFALINTETQKIEHHFVGSVFTWHSDDITTIVYARYNTIQSFDGTLFVDLVLGPGEYIRQLAYSEDKTQIIVTREMQDSSMQTSTIAWKPALDTRTTEYKFEIPMEDKLDYIVPVAIYGEIHPYMNPNRYAPSIQTNEYSPDGVGYVTFGIANDMKPPNVFSRYYTYRITQEGGYITSVEEVETITKETVLQNGTPYSGNPVGRFTGITYNRIRTASVSGNEISVGSYQNHTDAGGTYTGTYTYDAKTGDFWAELAFGYHNNGTFRVNDPESISGKLYEYGGFIHFVCTDSHISTVNAKEELPMTFSVIGE